MLTCTNSGVYSSPEGVAVAPISKKKRRTDPDLQGTMDVLSYEGFTIGYSTNRWFDKLGSYREHCIDVYGLDVGFEGLSKEEVFQQLDAWLDSKHKTQNHGGEE